MYKDRLIEIKLPKCTLFLTTGEIEYLLKLDPDIWARALKRGKGVLRAKQRESRQRVVDHHV